MSKDMKKVYDKRNSSYSSKIMVKSVVITIICIILAIICLLPIYILIINATRNNADIARGILDENNVPQAWRLFVPGSSIKDNFEALRSFEAVNIFRGFGNSFIIAAGSTILSILFSSLTAYGLFVYDFKLKGPAFTFVVAILMVPAQISAVGFVRMMASIGLYDSYVPLIIPAIAAPATVFFIRQFMKSSFPVDIVEAARIDGSNEFRTFVTIGLPMLKPAIAVQTIFAFIANWNNYFMPSMLISDQQKHTLPMMINALGSDRIVNFGMIYMGIALSIVPLMVVYFLLSKFIVEGVALGGVKE